MTNILTPEQVEAIEVEWQHGRCTFQQAFDMMQNSHKALQKLCGSWQATAEEATDINVNKALTARHEMREAALKDQLAKALADLKSGAGLYVRLQDKYDELESQYAELEARYATHQPG